MALGPLQAAQNNPQRLFVNMEAYQEKMEREELEGLCAFQALVHALTVKGRCHCWVTLSSREAGLQPDTVVVGVGVVVGEQCTLSLSPDSHQSPYWNQSMNAKQLRTDSLKDVSRITQTAAGIQLSRQSNLRQYLLGWGGGLVTLCGCNKVKASAGLLLMCVCVGVGEKGAHLWCNGIICSHEDNSCYLT